MAGSQQIVCLVMFPHTAFALAGDISVAESVTGPLRLVPGKEPYWLDESGAVRVERYEVRPVSHLRLVEAVIDDHRAAVGEVA